MPDVPADKVKQFFNSYRAKKMTKGETLLLPGDTVQYVYYLEKGLVKQYAVSAKGDEAILNLFKPPAFFPMSHVMNTVPVKHIFEAVEACTMRVAPADDVTEFLRQNPDILYDLLQRVYRGTDGLLGKIESLMTYSAQHRLIIELTTQARRFGDSTAEGVKVVLTEQELAARTGLTRETISREIHKLKTRKLIKAGRGRILIPDVDKLEERTIAQ